MFCECWLIWGKLQVHGLHVCHTDAYLISCQVRTLFSAGIATARQSSTTMRNGFWTIETKLNITYWQDYRFSWVWCLHTWHCQKIWTAVGIQQPSPAPLCAATAAALKLHSFWPDPDWFSRKSIQFFLTIILLIVSPFCWRNLYFGGQNSIVAAEILLD